MTTAATTTTSTTNGTTDATDTNGKTRAAPTPAEAITKISKILDQLSANDRKRVLAFFNVSAE